MKDLTTDNEETTETAPDVIDWGNVGNTESDSAPVKGFDLSEYKSLDPDTTETGSIDESKTDTGSDSETDPDINDPRFYFQSGKKKGQRRPQPKGVNVSFKNPTTEKVLSGEIISGALFLSMIDMVLPMILAGLNNQFTKVKIDPDKMQLTDKQKKELEPLFNAIVKAIKFEGNPVLLGVVGLGSIYAMNFIMLRTAAKIEQQTKHE